jgi:hypothetical protein
MVTATLDPEYDQLERKIQPRMPANREENTRLLAEIEELMSRGEDSLSPAEDAMLGMLFSLVPEYEQRSFPRNPLPRRCSNSSWSRTALRPAICLFPRE